MPYIIEEVVPCIFLGRCLCEIPPTDSSSKTNEGQSHLDAEAPQMAESRRPQTYAENKGRPRKPWVQEGKRFTTNQLITWKRSLSTTVQVIQ